MISLTAGFLLLTFQKGGHAAPKYAGLYRTVSISAADKDEESTRRPGEVRYLRLLGDHRWEWRDMMVGYSGTWEAKGRDIRLRVLSTPRGKPPRPQTLRLVADPDGKRLRAVDPKLGGRRLMFVYDPNLLQRLAKEMDRRLKDAKRKPKSPKTDLN